MFRAFLQPRDTSLDAIAMATSLAQTQFHYRALTSIAEDFEYYVTPHQFIPAFNLSPDLLAPIEAVSIENISATMRALFKWDSLRTPVGWPRYANFEKIEFFGTWWKYSLTELSRMLLTESGVYFVVFWLSG